jgi:acetyltransferase-like isoleucine patch superfamily enzyme
MDDYRIKIAVYANLYSLLRYAPFSFMDNVRSFFYKSIGVSIGKRVRIRMGAIIDCWARNMGGGIGDNVFIGENSVVSSSVKIGHNTSINCNTYIVASPPTMISIGNDCLIAQNVVIRSNDHAFDDPFQLIRKQGRKGQDIQIGNDCWIGANTTILKGVRIGDHSIVGAGAVVTKNIPSYSVAVGNPARVIRTRSICL